MTVSIVIPVYNAEKYLAESIESCINQTYADKEIVVVIHDCTDNSLQILQKYQSKIRIIEAHNLNSASAWNLAIKNATGEWIKIMSADDILYPQAIEELMKVITNFKDSKKTIFYSNWDGIDSNGKVIREVKEPNRNYLYLFEQNTLLLSNYYANFISTIIHKSAFEKFGYFNEKLIAPFDQEFYFRVCLEHGFRFFLVPKNLLQYRYHDEQLTITAQPLQELPKVKKMALSNLDHKLRKKYENRLKELNKESPFKKFLYKSLVKVFSQDTADNVRKIYRNLSKL